MVNLIRIETNPILPWEQFKVLLRLLNAQMFRQLCRVKANSKMLNFIVNVKVRVSLIWLWCNRISHNRNLQHLEY